MKDLTIKCYFVVAVGEERECSRCCCGYDPDITGWMED